MFISKKSLGQNFLTSSKIVNDIILAGNIRKTDTIIEIGPGKGVMSEQLLSTGANIICIEKDDRLIPILEKKFENQIASNKLKLIHADILDFDIRNIKENNYKVVANIPYYITGQIIRKFLESDYKPSSMTLLVQKEVAQRIVARDKKESLLSLSVKIFGDPRIVRLVGRGAFSPAPNVDSAVINIENISNEKIKEVSPELFFKVLHAGFAHKRKQLLPNLSKVFNKEKVEKTLETLNIDKKIRAEDVSLLMWVKLSKLLVDI